MNNGWLKVAIFSFVGIIISVIGLGVISTINNSTAASSMAGHQMTADSTQQGTMNHGSMSTDINTGSMNHSSMTTEVNTGTMNQNTPNNNTNANYYAPNLATQQELLNAKWQVEYLKLKLLQMQFMYNMSNTNNSNVGGSMNNSDYPIGPNSLNGYNFNNGYNLNNPQTYNYLNIP